MTDPTFLLNDNFGYAYTQHLRQSLSAQLNRAEIVPKPPNFRQWIDRPEVRPDDPNNDPKIKEKLNLYLAQYNQITNAPDLNTANLRFAKGVYAFLPKVNLSQAEMAGADFTRANMSLADLFLADLRGSTLSEAILLKADLTQADCRRAKMVGVDLRGAKLNSADLRNANLTGALLQGATYIPSGEYATKWPDEITAEYLRKVGAVAVDKKGKVLEASQSAPTKP